MNTKQIRETRKIELVEIQNIAMSLMRLKNAPGSYDQKWKRALYYAFLMADCGSTLEQKAVREALELP